MLRRLISPKNVTYQEARRLTQPAMLATFVLGGLLILIGLRNLPPNNIRVLSFMLGMLGICYGFYVFYIIVPMPARLQKWRWGAVLTHAILIGAALIVVPADLDGVVQVVMILTAAVTVILWERLATFVFLALTIIFHLLVIHWLGRDTAPLLLSHFSMALLGFVLVEIIHRLGLSTSSRIQRLESLNEFSRKITYSLETDELITLVGAAVLNAIKADTYFLSIMHDAEMINFDLIVDEGEYFPAARVPIAGTLSGWVIRNQRSLFIPDLRSEAEFEDARMVLIGKNASSLSWIGVPMQAGHINGIIAVGSYRPNDFDRTDLELLENLGQQAALALDNAVHHAEVEMQSHRDSLTGAFNHGYFLEILNHEAEQDYLDNTPLSLIMLDIDYFKQYNDNYGHLVGDQVLTMLTDAISTHIDSDDSIGRWGGEEFAILLPHTSGAEAVLVAERIRTTMNALSIQGRDGKHLPVPTVSQGIAVFPQETDAVDRLIDLADQRLYLAKERGRNQIEPDARHWRKPMVQDLPQRRGARRENRQNDSASHR